MPTTASNLQEKRDTKTKNQKQTGFESWKFKKSRLRCDPIQAEEAGYRIEEMLRSLVAPLPRGRRIKIHAHPPTQRPPTASRRGGVRARVGWGGGGRTSSRKPTARIRSCESETAFKIGSETGLPRIENCRQRIGSQSRTRI